jgi:hypothetical protein
MSTAIGSRRACPSYFKCLIASGALTPPRGLPIHNAELALGAVLVVLGFVLGAWPW